MRLVTLTDYAKIHGMTRQHVWINADAGKLDRIYVCGTPLLKVKDDHGYPSLDYKQKDQYITVTEVSKKLGIGETLVKQNAKFNQFEAVKIGKKWFFPSKQFEKVKE